MRKRSPPRVRLIRVAANRIDIWRNVEWHRAVEHFAGLFILIVALIDAEARAAEDRIWTSWRSFADEASLILKDPDRKQ